MSNEKNKNSTNDSSYWRFVEQTAKQADAMPSWMKGGTSEQQQREPKPVRAAATMSGARKK